MLAAACAGCDKKNSAEDAKGGDGPATETPTPTEVPATPTPTPVPIHASISTKIPSPYQRYRVKDGGSIEEISYPTQDYLSGDGTTYEKPAFVYLPPNYDKISRMLKGGKDSNRGFGTKVEFDYSPEEREQITMDKYFAIYEIGFILNEVIMQKYMEKIGGSFEYISYYHNNLE